jgi:SAM-dependent methyltransferase
MNRFPQETSPLAHAAGAIAARPAHPALSARDNWPYTLGNYFFTSLQVGVRSLIGPYPREAAARLVNPLSYPRFMEFDLALRPLAPLDGCTVLDLGSPKLPALLVARHSSCQLYATDIRDYFIAPTAHFLNRMGLGERVGRDIVLETQDARSLTYADEFFDRVFSISVVEHIPGDGDTQAIRDIARVLKPGGRVTLTVPFRAQGYWEEFVQGTVFERSAASRQATFYQRHYDAATLSERLIDPSGLRLVQMELFGEPGLRFEPYWNRIPMRWKLPLLWAQPFLAAALLRKLEPGKADRACGVALTLEK